VALCGSRVTRAAAVTLPGTSGNYISTPSSAALSIAGDIDIRIQAAKVWSSTTVQRLVTKYNTGAGLRSYLLDMSATAGTPRLILSADGTANTIATASAAVPFADNAIGWVRVTWRQSDGRVQFFTSTDGVTWTQLGTNQTIAIASIKTNTTLVNVGASDNGTVNPLNGKVYYAEIRNGIGGTVVGSFDPSQVTILGTRNPTTYSDGTNTWTVNGTTWNWLAATASGFLAFMRGKR
jgi:hypothetical protein